MDNKVSLGIDIGGTKTAVGLLRDGRLTARAETPTPTGDRELLLDAIHGLVAPLLDQAGTIGVCAPGYLDPRSGRIGHASNLPALAGLALAGAVSGRLGRQAVAANDADAAALAEFRLGAARETGSAFYLTVSTGIGGGFVGPGGLLKGNSGSAAELGHLCIDPQGAACACGGRGCLETVASGTAIAARATEAYGRPVSTATVFSDWRAGSSVAAAVIETATVALGRGLAAVAQLLDPQVIVIGGSVAVHNPDFVAETGRQLAACLHNRPGPEIRLAALGADAGVIGAALLPLEAA